jgi:RNA polymerase sigma-70 factor (ECF subfamily)
LYRIARDRAFRVLRRRQPPTCPLAEEEVPDPGKDVEFAAEDVERVHAALDQLVPEHREVLVLRFLEGMAYEDMARVIGCPVGTVRSRLHYAKRELRRTVERMGEDE